MAIPPFAPPAKKGWMLRLSEPPVVVETPATPASAVTGAARTRRPRFVVVGDFLGPPESRAVRALDVGDGVTVLVVRTLQRLTPEDETLLRDFAEAQGVQFWLQPKGPDSITLLIGAAGRAGSAGAADRPPGGGGAPPQAAAPGPALRRPCPWCWP